MKKIALRFFVSFLIIPVFFLSGCLFFFDNPDEYSEGQITTFKACYRAESYEIDNTISSYAKLVVGQLYSNFGILNDYRYPSLIENKPDSDNNSNYDKIRVQTDTDGVEINNDIFWRWTFLQNLDQATSLESGENAAGYYETPALQNAYYSAYVPVYSVAMEIVLYEIILGKTPTNFTIDINNELGSTKVYADTLKTKEVFADEETECEPLLEIKNEFKTKAQYIGLTSANVQTLNDYILNKVIGDGIIGGIYDRVIVGGQNKILSFVVQQILQLEPIIEGSPDQKSIYSPYPASYIKDFEGGSFYVGSGSNSFEHIPALEYQSVVMLPDENDSYLSIFLAFESESDIEITASLKYCNNQIETVIDSQELSVKAGAWSVSDLCWFNFDSNNKVSAFSVNQLKTSKQKVINNSTGLANFYSVTDNSKIGVLNKEKINQAYFEFTFEVHKNSSKDYYPYKVGVFALWNA